MSGKRRRKRRDRGSLIHPEAGLAGADLGDKFKRSETETTTTKRQTEPDYGSNPATGALKSALHKAAEGHVLGAQQLPAERPKSGGPESSIFTVGGRDVVGEAMVAERDQAVLREAYEKGMTPYYRRYFPQLEEGDLSKRDGYVAAELWLLHHTFGWTEKRRIMETVGKVMGHIVQKHQHTVETGNIYEELEAAKARIDVIDSSVVDVEMEEDDDSLEG